ncbi:MAG: hypothetical protein ACK495_26735, partial [Bradyrhizobium sp.]
LEDAQRPRGGIPDALQHLGHAARFGAMRHFERASLIYKELAASTVENAQLAALEVTHGAEAGGMPEMLESIRNSTARTLGILEHLVWYRSQSEE